MDARSCLYCMLTRLACKVGRSKPPPVLTSGLTGYNRPGQYSLKWSLLVNTHQSGRLEILNVFCGGLIDIYGQILFMVRFY